MPAYTTPDAPDKPPDRASPEAALAWLRLLYGDDPDPDAGYLNVWTDTGRERSFWFPLTDLAGAARKAGALAEEGQNAYYGVALRARRYVDGLVADRRVFARGASPSVSALPAFWIDFDLAGPAHTEKALPPTLRDGIALLDTALPAHLRPSAYVLSGHGLHGYWLLADQPWELESEAERQRAAALLRRLQRTIRDAAQRRGWRLDNTADLARVLRLPGTINRKPGLPPVAVRVLETRGTGHRFNPRDFEEWAGLAADPGEDPAAAGAPAGDFAPADWGAIVNGCAFMRHCRDDAAALAEPDWYAMLGVVARCDGGEALAHELSRPYAGYTPAETRKKLAHALTHGPRRCASIASELGFRGCQTCPVYGEIASPIVLGNPPDGPIDRTGNSEQYPENSENGHHRGRYQGGRGNSEHSEHSETGSPDDAAAWDAPEPLTAESLPAFPTDALPVWLRAYVAALAEATQTPADLAALMSLGVLSAAAGGRVKVWVRSAWQEPVNLYVSPAQESGNRKSGVVREVTAPIREWERRREQERRPDVAAARSQRRVAEQALAHAEARAAKESDPGQRAALLTEAEQLARRLELLPAVHPPRLLTEDCTPERLAGLLAEQGGRMAILSPEGDVFDIMGGRYSSAPNVGIFLKGHAGDPHHVDRQGRPAEYIAAPALTIAVSPQPDVLGGLADTPSFRGRGLLARFLYALPPSLLGRRSIHPEEVPDAVRSTYQTAVLALLERFQTATPSAGEDAHHYLKPDPGAASALDDFLAWIEPQLGPHGELAAVRDWGGKLAGAVVRIAALLHLAEQPTDPAAWKARISHDVLQRAIRIGTYLIPHAQAAYDLMGLDTDTGNARRLLDWILAKRKDRFTKREAHQANKGRFKTVAELDPVLQLLEERGYLRREVWERPKGQRGQPPSPTYVVNPAALVVRAGHPSHNSQNAQNSPVPERGGVFPEPDQNAQNAQNSAPARPGVGVRPAAAGVNGHALALPNASDGFAVVPAAGGVAVAVAEDDPEEEDGTWTFSA